MDLLKITVTRYLKGEVEFFCFCHTSAAATNVQQNLDSYLNDKNCSLEDLEDSNRSFLNIILEYLPVPQWNGCSALVQWWADTDTYRRHKLSDIHIEMLLLCGTTRT